MLVTVRVCVLVVHDGRSRPEISLHTTEGEARAALAGRVRDAWSVVRVHRPDVDPYRLSNREVVDCWFAVVNSGREPGAPDRARWRVVWRPVAVDVVSIPLARRDVVDLVEGARVARAQWHRAINGRDERAVFGAGARMAGRLLRWHQAVGEVAVGDRPGESGDRVSRAGEGS
ncbi:MAG: hypothetical protein HOV94_13450 [Saccharothrix sp.]|nr:hypothetical protein [Saccharothrix sp.]